MSEELAIDETMYIKVGFLGLSDEVMVTAPLAIKEGATEDEVQEAMVESQVRVGLAMQKAMADFAPIFEKYIVSKYDN
jgi:hypothetical protein